MSLKPRSQDVKALIKFEKDELYLLQDNTWQMAESFGLDRRIANLTGKRKVGFYMWDLECLEMVARDIPASTEINKTVAESLYGKIKNAIDFIDNQK
jgi:hypothetical protein